MNKGKLYLFIPQKSKLPKWFLEYNWKMDVINKPNSIISDDTGIKKFEVKQWLVRVSLPERAILECLHMSPQLVDLTECYQMLEGLVNLKPKLVSNLLEKCNSVKVKRLFLYMAEKANHQWFNFIEPGNIDIGKGNRMLSENGIYVSKYSISIPKELAEL